MGPTQSRPGPVQTGLAGDGAEYGAVRDPGRNGARLAGMAAARFAQSSTGVRRGAAGPPCVDAAGESFRPRARHRLAQPASLAIGPRPAPGTHGGRRQPRLSVPRGRPDAAGERPGPAQRVAAPKSGAHGGGDEPDRPGRLFPQARSRVRLAGHCPHGPAGGGQPRRAGYRPVDAGRARRRRAAAATRPRHSPDGRGLARRRDDRRGRDGIRVHAESRRANDHRQPGAAAQRPRAALHERHPPAHAPRRKHRGPPRYRGAAAPAGASARRSAGTVPARGYRTQLSADGIHAGGFLQGEPPVGGGGNRRGTAGNDGCASRSLSARAPLEPGLPPAITARGAGPRPRDRRSRRGALAGHSDASYRRRQPVGRDRGDDVVRAGRRSVSVFSGAIRFPALYRAARRRRQAVDRGSGLERRARGRFHSGFPRATGARRSAW